MSALIRAYDWGTTPLGLLGDWPDSLKAAVDLMLRNSSPISIFWGGDFLALYNDQWRELIGDKHPNALGRPAREFFSEIWGEIGPMFAKVAAGQGHLRIEDRHFPLNRLGQIENAWFSFSLSEIPLEDGSVGGIFNIAAETTTRVLAERALRESEERQAFLLKLSDALRPLADPDEIKRVASILLGKHLGVSRTVYAEIVDETWADARDDYALGVPSIGGRFLIEDYGSTLVESFRRGESLVFDDVTKDPRFSTAEQRNMVAIGARANVGVGLVKGGRWAAAFGVHSTTPRTWTATEIYLVRETADRTWEAVERARAEAALRTSQSQLAAVTEHAPIGIGLFDKEGRWVFKNPALDQFHCDLISFIDPAQIGLWYVVDENGKAVPREDWPCAKALRGEAVSPGSYFRTEINCEDRWLRVSAAPIHGDDGERQAVAIAEDVTEQRRADEQRKNLMREVNHRSKNMLSMVQAIAQMSAGAEDSDFVSRFRLRLHALAANHDLLVQSEWQGVDLEGLVRSQLAHLGDLFGERITFCGPPLAIAADASQSLGMALHELVTNAVKYGALSTPEGRVNIDWGVQKDETGDLLFSVCWKEDGGPEVVPPTHTGFGTTIVCDIVEQNLGADVSLVYARSGLVWNLKCAMKQCVEAGGELNPEKWRRHARLSSFGKQKRARILVVEDEALLAIELSKALRGAGFEVLGPVPSVSRALALLQNNSCDVAVLDVNLRNETAEPIAEKLTREQTPFFAVSGYARNQLPAAFQHARLLPKPIKTDDVIWEIERTLDLPT